MKKYTFLTLAAAAFLGSCSLTFTGSRANNASDGTSLTSNSTGNVTDTDSKYIPVLKKDELKSNIGSYSHSFIITTFDGIYNYDVKFNKDLQSGFVTREDGNDHYFYRDPTDWYLAYYQNDFGSGYSNDYGLYLDYMNNLFDISSDLFNKAPFASKKALTYAERECTEYIISDSRYIAANDTKLDIILDNKTGAILQLTYDHIDYYKSTKFVPNDEAAAAAVLSKRNSEIQSDFINKEVLNMFGLADIEIPAWESASGTFNEKDGKLDQYSFQILKVMPDHEPIKAFAKSVFDKGIKKDINGETKTFDELWEFGRADAGEKTLDKFVFDAYASVDNINYNVVVQGTHDLSTQDEWFMTFSTSRPIEE